MRTQLQPEQAGNEAQEPQKGHQIWPLGEKIPAQLYGLALVTGQGIVQIAALDLGDPVPDTISGQVEFTSNCARKVISALMDITGDGETWQEIAQRLQREAEENLV